MAEEKDKKEPKHKDPRIALGIAAFAAVSTIGDAARSYFERQGDVEVAARAEANRVAVDKSIQDGVREVVEDLNDEVDELDEEIEAQDRALFELRVEVEAQGRIIEAMGGVDQELREMLMLEALEDEAKKENHVVRVEVAPSQVKAEDRVEKTAKRIAKKKKAKDKRTRPVLNFLEPEPQYFQQQIHRKMPLPPPAKK